MTHPAANKASVVDFLSADPWAGDMPNDILIFEKSGDEYRNGKARILSKEKLTLLEEL